MRAEAFEGNEEAARDVGQNSELLQWARIDQADLSDQDKKQLLRDNAVRLVTSHRKCEFLCND